VDIAGLLLLLGLFDEALHMELLRAEGAGHAVAYARLGGGRPVRLGLSGLQAGGAGHRVTQGDEEIFGLAAAGVEANGELGSLGGLVEAPGLEGLLGDSQPLGSGVAGGAKLFEDVGEASPLVFG